MICPLGTDCRTVIESEYSHFWGIRLEFLGMAYYLLITATYISFIVYPYLAFPELIFSVLILSALAFLFSGYLAGVQAFALNQWCTWCLASAGISTLIFVAALASFGSAFLPLLLAHERLLSIIILFATGIGLGASLIGDIFLLKSLRDLRISKKEVDILRTIGEVVHSALALLLLAGGAFWITHGGITSATSLVIIQIIAVALLLVAAFALNVMVVARLAKISFTEAHLHLRG